METFWLFSFVSTWIFAFFFPSECSEMDTPKLKLNGKVFVAFADERLKIKYDLYLTANRSREVLTCSDPDNEEIYKCNISETAGLHQNLILELNNLKKSGEYSCKYKEAKAYWFLRVRVDGYKDSVMWDYTETRILAVFIAVLLVFSVVGSVYVFRGQWKECITGCGDTTRKRKKNREQRKETQMQQDNVDAIIDPSTSFYASLEPRPRSIYDVLDHSAANREPEQSEAKPKKKQPQKPKAQTKQQQQEETFESVYENF